MVHMLLRMHRSCMAACIYLVDFFFTTQVRLKHSKEVVCLAMTDSLVAVGSQSHISLVDPRKKTPVQEIESLDHSHGADLDAQLTPFNPLFPKGVEKLHSRAALSLLQAGISGLIPVMWRSAVVLTLSLHRPYEQGDESLRSFWRRLLRSHEHAP